MTGPVQESPGDHPNVEHLLDAATLPCGVQVDALLEQVADGHAADLDAHQQDCVHCQAALTELAVLWAPVTEQAATPVPVPPGLTAAVMSQIRGMVHDAWYTLQVTDPGGIRIAARIVARLARDAARVVPGVRVALGRSTQDRLAAMAERATAAHRHPHAAVGVLGQTAVVDLAVAVSYGDPVHEVARDIQRQVITTLRDIIGLQSVTVNVTVDDVLTDDDQLQGRPTFTRSGTGWVLQRTRVVVRWRWSRCTAAVSSRAGQGWWRKATTRGNGSWAGWWPVPNAWRPEMNASGSPPRSG